MLGLRVMHLDTSSGSRIGPVGLLPGLPPLVGEYDVTVESSLFTSDVIGGYTLNDYIALYTEVRRSGLNMRVRTCANEEGSGIVELPGRVTITDEALYDWIGGVALTAPLGHSGKWRAVLEADTLIDGDNDTNYQLNGFIAHHFNERHSVWFGYRYLNMVRSMRVEGSRVETDFVQSGPTLGWAFTF